MGAYSDSFIQVVAEFACCAKAALWLQFAPVLS